MRKTISSKLILGVASALIATVGVFSYVLTHSQHRALITQVEHNAYQISETIKSGTHHDMLLNRRDSLHQTMDTFGKQDGIEQVRIFNKDGEIIYSSDPAAVGSMVDKRAEACYACHAADQPLEHLSGDQHTRIFAGRDGVRTLGVINPIYNSPSCRQADCHAHERDQTVLGVLDVTMSLAAVDERLVADTAKAFLFAATAVIASSLIIWLVFRRLVGGPVKRLVDATRSVADGDLNCQVHVKRDDELGHLADSFNDMTRRLVETQQQLYQSDKLASLGRLAAGVAHEINNPLTGVLTYSSFLLKRARDPETKEDLTTIVEETKRCRQIVKDLLDFSRQVKPTKTTISLDEIIEHSLRIVNNRLGFDHISVSREISPHLPPIRADRNQLIQVFINLFVNAADAIGEHGGRIRIAAEPCSDNEQVRIVVSDSGCGIAAEDVSKVFEPFYTTKQQEGTGLGLAVAWGIIDKHGGTIDIQSDRDRGTTVEIRLPAESAAALVAEVAR